MIPQAGSAYAYSYATLGELVAWIIGWDLILEYAVGNVAVAISWGDYFTTLLRNFGRRAPGVDDDRLSDGAAQLRSADSRAADIRAARRRHPDPRSHPGVLDRDGDHLAAAARRARERDREQHHGGHQADGARAVRGRRRDASAPGELHALCAERVPGHSSGRRDCVLRVHRVRRDLHRGGGNAESAAQPADRHPRRPGDLHAHLRDRRFRADRHGAVQGARGRRPAGARARALRLHHGQLDRRAGRGGLDVGRAAGVPVRPAAHLLRHGSRRAVAEVGRALEPRHQGAVHDDDHHGAVRGGVVARRRRGRNLRPDEHRHLVRLHPRQHRRARAALQGARAAAAVPRAVCLAGLPAVGRRLPVHHVRPARTRRGSGSSAGW